MWDHNYNLNINVHSIETFYLLHSQIIGGTRSAEWIPERMTGKASWWRKEINGMGGEGEFTGITEYGDIMHETFMALRQ